MFDFRQTRRVVLAGAVRTPIGSFGGSLQPLSAVDLGVVAAESVLPTLLKVRTHRVAKPM